MYRKAKNFRVSHKKPPYSSYNPKTQNKWPLSHTATSAKIPSKNAHNQKGKENFHFRRLSTIIVLSPAHNRTRCAVSRYPLLTHHRHRRPRSSHPTPTAVSSSLQQRPPQLLTQHFIIPPKQLFIFRAIHSSSQRRLRPQKLGSCPSPHAMLSPLYLVPRMGYPLHITAQSKWPPIMLAQPPSLSPAIAYATVS